MTEGQEYIRPAGGFGSVSAGLLLPTVIAHDTIMAASNSRNAPRAILLNVAAYMAPSP